METVGHQTQYHRLAQTEPFLTRTYQIGRELVDRIDAAALELGVGQSDLVRFLLARALDEVETGTLQVPTKPARLQIVDYSG